MTRYAAGLDHPRWIYVLPNGDVLVAESATEPKAPKSIMDRLQAWLERNNGSVTPSANRITLLRDFEGTGRSISARRSSAVSASRSAWL